MGAHALLLCAQETYHTGKLMLQDCVELAEMHVKDSAQYFIPNSA